MALGSWLNCGKKQKLRRFRVSTWAFYSDCIRNSLLNYATASLRLNAMASLRAYRPRVQHFIILSDFRRSPTELARSAAHIESHMILVLGHARNWNYQE